MKVCKLYTALMLALTVLAVLPSRLLAWQDSFGAPDTVRVESITGTPGQQISVRVFMTNDEPLGSLSVPLTYDTSKLTLTGISFTGGRVDYLGMKLLNPELPANTHGHFLVGALVMLETYIPAGSGVVFTANFTISPNAVLGTKTVIDSLFFAPGGELILAEATTAGSIYPVFVAGEISIAQFNNAPSIAPIPTQYIFEGDALNFPVNCSDPDGNPLSISCPTKPTGASFTANGTVAQFAWTPGFTGSLSSDGSPFRVVVSANDGQVSVQREVQVNVLNRNRRPAVTSQPSVGIIAGEFIQVPVSVSEPDFESVTWTILGAPNGSEFDLAAKGGFVWQTGYTDTGLTTITFIASDPHGAADTSTTQISVAPAQLYSLAIDTVEGNPGETVNLTVSLNNAEPIAGFNLLIHLDASSLALAAPIQKGSRILDWELLEYSNNSGGITGNIRIVGGADQAGGSTIAPLAAGSGPILVIPVRIAGNVGLGGFSIPVRFAFEDAPANNDNTLISPAGGKIAQSEIDYFDGEVFVKSMGTVLIGDVNLNGVAAEVADIIYFSNHMVNPVGFPFNALQYANSDVNRDNVTSSIADLVALIQWVVTGDGPPAKLVASSDLAVASLFVDNAGGKTMLKYSSDEAIGGMLVTVMAQSPITSESISIPRNMSSANFSDGASTRILIYSMRGANMPAGTETALTVDGDVEIALVEVASSAGQTMTTTLEKVSPLPTHFALEQNYPNPFNPSTQISFSLVAPQRVRLTVFNILGETIMTLANSDYPAGEHTVTWDGRSSGGHAVSSGVYFYRLEAGGQSLTRKMMLVK